MIAWFIPGNISRIFGLIASTIALAWSIIAVGYFEPNEHLLVDFGLRFVRFSIDSLGFTMILLTNAVFFLVFLSNFNTSIVHEKRFTALALLMQFGLLGLGR